MKRTFNHTAASYQDATGGNVAAMFAICIFFVIGLLAMAIDLSNGFSSQQRLQDTTDAVALLAAQDKSLDTPAKLEQAAQALYDATYPGDRGVRIEIESITRDGDQVSIVTRNNIDTYFASIFNRTDLDVGVSSTAVFSKKSLDVVLVLDTTGSMAWPSPGNSSQSKLQGLKTAANGMIDTFDSLNNDDLRLSVVPFAQYMNVDETNENAAWLDLSKATGNSWKGCVGSRLNGKDETPTKAGGAIPGFPGQFCGSPILPLTSNMDKARTSIDGLQAKGWTYIPSGIVWGWRALEGEIPSNVPNPPTDTDHKNVMVIMTDGENTRSKSQLTHEAQNINAANSKTARLCENVKNDEIEVYTITYALDDATTKNLMRDCASDPTKFFDASTAADLNSAFDVIANNLETLRTTS